MNRIRRAEERDIPGILRLLLQVAMLHHEGRPDLFRAPATKYTEEELRELLQDEKKPIFVSVNEEDDVEGYVFCALRQLADHVLTDIRTLYIDDLCVEEKCRGKRLGRELYRFAEEFAREMDCYNLTLNVWCCNETALRFYEGCGMKPQKIGMESILKGKKR